MIKQFKFFKDYQYVLVTGPQRSGTTIAARIIAEDTGHQFIPEGALAVEDKDFEAKEALPLLLDKLRLQGDSAVIQCPIQCRYIHEVTAPDVMIVMMRRPVKDIVASEQRIGWGDARQRALYADVIGKYGTDESLPISKIKYVYWDRYQRLQIVKNKLGGEVYELQYASLEGHRLWCPKEERKYFLPRQIGHVEEYSEFKVMI